MFEFHGWFTIRESPEWMEEGSREGEIVEALQALINSFDWRLGVIEQDGSSGFEPDPNATIRLGYMNGACFLNLHGNKNHRSDRWPDIQTLLDHICREAPGSYGLLSWRDDEGEVPAGANNYQVMVMARGSVTTRLDPFLSPTVPVVENELTDL